MRSGIVCLLGLALISAPDVYAAQANPATKYKQTQCGGKGQPACSAPLGWVACWLDYTDAKDLGDSGTDNTTYNEMQMWNVTGHEHTCPNDPGKRCYPYVWTSQGLGTFIHMDKSGSKTTTVRVDSSGTGEFELVTRNSSERFDRYYQYLKNQTNNGQVTNQTNNGPVTVVQKPPYFEWPIDDIPATPYQPLWGPRSFSVNAGSSGSITSSTATAKCNAFFTRK